MCVSEPRPRRPCPLLPLALAHCLHREPGWLEDEEPHGSVWEPDLLSPPGPSKTGQLTADTEQAQPRSAEPPSRTRDLGTKLHFYLCMPLKHCSWWLHRITVAIDNNILGMTPVSLKFVWGAWFRINDKMPTGMDILYIILYEYYGRQNMGCSKSCLWTQSPELGEYANLMRHGTMQLGLRTLWWRDCPDHLGGSM